MRNPVFIRTTAYRDLTIRSYALDTVPSAGILKTELLSPYIQYNWGSKI